VPAVGIEPTTNGLQSCRSATEHFLIKLLQHTPSFKSSYEQPQSSCEEVNGVTKWLRSPLCKFGPRQCSERLQVDAPGVANRMLVA
jgi:hypothetical protein